MAAKKYPVDDWEQQVINEGVPIRDVAALAGVTPKVVRNHLNQERYSSIRKFRQGGFPSSHALSAGDVVKAYSKREAGMSWKELGKRYKMSESKVINILRYQSIQRGWVWPIKVKKT